MRMAGRMGGDRVTTKNLEIASVDVENNLIYIKGALPGPINGLIMIKGLGELKIAAPVAAEVQAPVVAEEAEVKAEAVEPVVEQAAE
jgi:hypothetical protein